MSEDLIKRGKYLWSMIESVALASRSAMAFTGPEIEAIFAYAQAAARPETWRLIETAPKDGRRVLLVDDLDRWTYIGKWVAGAGDDGLWLGEDDDVPDEQPDHWQPLPAAPLPPEQGDGNG